MLVDPDEDPDIQLSIPVCFTPIIIINYYMIFFCFVFISKSVCKVNITF